MDNTYFIECTAENGRQIYVAFDAILALEVIPNRGTELTLGSARILVRESPATIFEIAQKLMSYGRTAREGGVN